MQKQLYADREELFFVRFKYIAGESLQEKLLVLLALTSQLPVAGTVAQCLVYRATVCGIVSMSLELCSIH